MHYTTCFAAGGEPYADRVTLTGKCNHRHTWVHLFHKVQDCTCGNGRGVTALLGTGCKLLRSSTNSNTGECCPIPLRNCATWSCPKPALPDILLYATSLPGKLKLVAFCSRCPSWSEKRQSALPCGHPSLQPLLWQLQWLQFSVSIYITSNNICQRSKHSNRNSTPLLCVSDRNNVSPSLPGGSTDRWKIGKKKPKSCSWNISSIVLSRCNWADKWPDSKGSPCCCMQLAWLPLVRSAAEVWAQDGSSPHQCWHRCVLTVPGKHLPAQITTTAAIRAFALMFISIKTHCSSLCCTLMCSSSPLLPLPERLSATLSRLHHC